MSLRWWNSESPRNQMVVVEGYCIYIYIIVVVPQPSPLSLELRFPRFLASLFEKLLLAATRRWPPKRALASKIHLALL